MTRLHSGSAGVGDPNRRPVAVVLHESRLEARSRSGDRTDLGRGSLTQAGDAGLTALVCGTPPTSSRRERPGRREPSSNSLTELVRAVRVSSWSPASRRIIARLRTIARAARATRRDVVIAGASLKRNYAAARDCGYLSDVPPFLEEASANQLPRGRSLVICTGGQGEPRAALARMAKGEHPYDIGAG